MKKKKKRNYKKIIIITSMIVVVAFLVGLELYFGQESNELTRELKKDGYTTEDTDDAFYNKITTGNTLDDYYKDLSNKKNSNYEEYYFSKESYDFIEVKLSYKDEVTTSLNISSDLRTLETTYNFELSYKDAYLIIEGNSIEDYTCKTIVKEKVSEDVIKTYCDRMVSEINAYAEKREEVLNNEKIKELLAMPIQEAKEE